MAILEQLGLNSSFFFQFVIFAFAYIVLSRLVFTPYSQALEQREQRTTGGEDLAVEISKQADQLQNQYEAKAREVSGSVKTIFDEYRQGASKEYEKIVSKARSESQKLVEEARQKVTVEMSAAAAKIKAEAPIIAQEMTQRLLAK
ncbi:MAG: ATP synthase F0 subunit B [Pseudobdellovibrionaceae bacterium]